MVTWLPVVLIAVGLLLVGYSELKRHYRDTALQPTVQFAAEVSSTKTPVPTSPPARLTVPGVLDEPLEPQSYDDGRWTISETVGSYLTQSARPGEDGNIIIYGHNKAEIFGPLLNLSGSEPVIVRTADGREHRYRIVSQEEVTPDRVDVLAPTDTEVLTIYTCSGWLDSKRFVIRAVPEE